MAVQSRRASAVCGGGSSPRRARRTRGLAAGRGGGVAAAAILAAGTLLHGRVASAASATWSATPGDANWIPSPSTDTNWSTGPGLFPGSTSALNNQDIGTFNTNSTLKTIAINSATLDIGGITFDTAAGNFVIGAAGANAGNALLLSSNTSGTTGIIQVAATLTGTNVTETINAPLVIEPLTATTIGSYTFANNSATASNVLNIAGNVTGGTTNFLNTTDVAPNEGGSIVLNLAGANTGLNTISGVISDGGAGGTVGTGYGLAINKTGSGTWYFTGANTYTGETAVISGILNVASLSNYGVAGSLGGRTLAEETNGHGGIGLLIAGGTLQYTGSTNQTTNRQIRLGASATNAIDSSGTGSVQFTFAGNGLNLFQVAGTRSLTLTGTNTGNNLFTQNLAPQAANATTFNKTGAGSWTYAGVDSGAENVNVLAGTLTLSNANTYTGTTTVSGGNLVVNASGGAITGTSTVTVSSAAGAGGSLFVNGALVAGTVTVGTTAAAGGAVYVNGTLTNTNAGGGGFQVGGATGAYGYMNVAGGAVVNVAGEIDPGGSSGGAGTFGQIDLAAGGTINLPNIAGSYLLPDRGAAGEAAVVNVGGTFQISGGGTPANSGLNGLAVGLGNVGSLASTVTLSGSGQFLTPSLTVKLNDTNFGGTTGNATNVSVLNLNGGTFQTLGFGTAVNQAAGGVTGNNAAVVNFNGGTLKAGNAGNTSFLGLAANGLAAANVFAGGGAIDNNGQAIAIAVPLVGTDGTTGVGSVTLAAGGSGYTTPPQVTFTGGTTTGGIAADAATGYATVNAAGQVTGIVITSPGSYSVAPTGIALNSSSGTGASAAVAAAQANTSGTMTFRGTGTTTLSGVNTYAGATTVSAGTLLVNGSLAAGSTVGVASAASLGGSGTVNGAVNSAGTLVPGGAGAIGTLTLAGTTTLTGGTLSLDLSAASNAPGGTTNDELAFNGLVARSTVLVTPSFLGGGTPAVGTAYTIGTYAGVTGSGNFTAATRAFNVSSTAGDGTTAGSLIAIYTGGTAANITWHGQANATWDVVNTANWYDQGTTTSDRFYQGDFVTFDDTAVPGTTAISVATIVQPGSVTVSANTLNYSFSGAAIGGTGTLSKTGGDVLTINNANTYTGGTNLAGGTLNVNAATALGTGPLAFNGSSAIDNTSGAPVTLTSNNAQAWNADFSYGGTNSLNLGTGAVTLGGNRTITTAGTGTLTVGGPISNASGGAYGLTVAGTGALTLTGNATYTGPTVVNGGTLAIVGANNAISISKTSSVTINSGGTISIVGDNNYLSPATTVPTTINPGGVLTTNVATTTNHLGPLTLAGGTLASNGTPAGDGLTYGSFNLDAGLTAGGVTATSTISALDVALTQAGGTVFNVAPGSASGVDLDVTGTLYHSAGAADTGLVKAGAGVLQLDSSNSYTGATNVSAGTLALNNANAVASSDLTPGSTVTFAAAVGGAFTIGGLSGVGNLNLADTASNPVALSVGNNTTAVVYTGNLTGSGSLVKIGTGTQVMAGANTYAGTTNVSAGVLQVGNGGTTGSLSPSSTILDNAVLQFNRTVPMVQGTDFATAPITGSGSVGVFGATTVTLNAANTYAGGTTIGAANSNNVLVAAATGALGSGAVSILGNVGTNELQLSGGSVTLANVINLSAKQGTAIAAPGIENVAGTNTLSGTITFQSGGSNYNLQSDAGTLTLAAATAISGGTLTGTRALSFAGAGNFAVTGVIANGSAVVPVTSAGPGTVTLTAANAYSGGTTVTGGSLLVNAAGTTGTGDVIVGGTGVLGGTGTAGNASTGAGATLGTGVVTINAGGTITAGASAAATGTLTTGAQSWNSSTGTFTAKVFDASNTSTGSAGNDRLVLSGLTIASGFQVNVSTALTSLSAGKVIVLADDKEAAGTNPFNTGGTVPAALVLQVNGSAAAAASDGLFLATQADTLGGGGYDLVLEGTAAAPEPTSLLLAGLAAAPLALGRRRRNR